MWELDSCFGGVLCIAMKVTPAVSIFFWEKRERGSHCIPLEVNDERSEETKAEMNPKGKHP